MYLELSRAFVMKLSMIFAKIVKSLMFDWVVNTHLKFSDITVFQEIVCLFFGRLWPHGTHYEHICDPMNTLNLIHILINILCSGGVTTFATMIFKKQLKSVPKKSFHQKKVFDTIGLDNITISYHSGCFMTKINWYFLLFA